MYLMRALLLRHRALALFVVMAALCMKIVVPTGFMIGQNSKVLTVQICNEAIGNHAWKQIVIPMKESGGDSDHKQGKVDCPFASLSMASMTGADLRFWRWHLPSSWRWALRLRRTSLVPSAYPTFVRHCADRRLSSDNLN